VELRRREDAHLAPGAQSYALYAGIAVASGEGSYLTDVDGNRYLNHRSRM
jgi:4-aminobutyrate aminotransferase-like enzyme